MKESLQYRRTDKAIVHAFITLCKKKSFEQLTIKDILDEALVSRNTFYAHYKDKYEIAEILFSDFISSLQDNLDAIYKSDSVSIYSLQDKKRTDALVQRHQKFNIENRDIVDVLLKIHTDQVNLIGSLEHYFFEKYYDDIHRQKQDADLTDTDYFIESKIYAAVETAIIQTGFTDINLTAAADPESLSRNIIQAALYAVGVRNHDTQKQLSDTIMNCRQNEMIKNRTV